MARSHVPGARCGVCDVVMNEARIELDLLMADPQRWPATIWDRWEPPGDVVPPAMRLWGAVKMGQNWLADHGYGDITKASVTEHYNRHVPLLPDAATVEAAKKAVDRALDPRAYLEFYAEGIRAGKKGVELLMKHVAELEAAGTKVPLPLIKMLVDVGGKLSMSQAGIVSRQPSQPTLDDDEDFRAGATGVPGPRIGHGRIRQIAGESRFVRDEGPKDRAEYAARQVQEGGTGLS